MKIRLSVAAFLCALIMGAQGAAAATTFVVDDDGLQCPTATFTSIQAAINAASSGDTILVCAGTYTENVFLNKSLAVRGAQWGVDARGRVASESVVMPLVPVVHTFELRTGSAGSIIDGFTFSLGTRAIESISGPLDGLQLLNNRIQGFTNAGVFLNDNGINITVNQNDIDGTAKVGAGDLFHLDTDNFDGFSFTNNRVANGLTATGFFVDGNHNVDKSTAGARTPLFDGNLIDRNQTGVNLGSRAWGDGAITGNTFSRNGFDGLQGGPNKSAISLNIFNGNGRSGLALTSFGNTVDPNRGAQNNTITQNCFTGNGFTQAGEGIFFSATQFPGTISTNVAHQNNIVGNFFGARYNGTETIDAELNWWGPTGPFNAVNNPSGTGNAVSNNVDAYPFRTTGAGGTPCSGPPATTLTLDPFTATNPVGTQHCVTATVTNAFGVPQAGVTVRFTVSGSVMTSGAATTDANGEAVFCYTGPALPGADAITAFADTNNNTMPDPGEPVGAASKVWVLPVTTPGCEIKITNGGWIIADNSDRANFGGNAVADEDGNVSGQEEYQDQGPADPFNLHGDVTVIVCDPDPTRATIFGDATIDGSGSHTFRIDVRDFAEPGKGVDTYRMRVDTYDSGEHTLEGGNIQIHR
jgi:hypothetical protein